MFFSEYFPSGIGGIHGYKWIQKAGYSKPTVYVNFPTKLKENANRLVLESIPPPSYLFALQGASRGPCFSSPPLFCSLAVEFEVQAVQPQAPEEWPPSNSPTWYLATHPGPVAALSHARSSTHDPGYNSPLSRRVTHSFYLMTKTEA